MTAGSELVRLYSIAFLNNEESYDTTGPWKKTLIIQDNFSTRSQLMTYVQQVIYPFISVVFKNAFKILNVCFTDNNELSEFIRGSGKLD